MPKYEVLEKSHLPAGEKGNRIYEAGETVDYDGLPGPNLKPLDAEGEAKQKEYFVALETQRKAREHMYPPEHGFDIKAFARELAKEIASATRGKA